MEMIELLVCVLMISGRPSSDENDVDWARSNSVHLTCQVPWHIKSGVVKLWQEIIG